MCRCATLRDPHLPKGAPLLRRPARWYLETRDPDWVRPDLTVLHTEEVIGAGRWHVEAALTFRESLSSVTPTAIFRNLCSGLMEWVFLLGLPLLPQLISLLLA